MYLIIVPSRGQELVIRGPFEPTDLLPVSLEPPLRLQGRGADVTLQDHPVPAPGRQLVRVPRQGTCSRGRASEAAVGVTEAAKDL